ncbi:MAG: hypothetical protein Q8P67_07360 [archaeon]|nr:hypothetical protein [archaeon]
MANEGHVNEIDALANLDNSVSQLVTVTELLVVEVGRLNDRLEGMLESSPVIGRLAGTMEHFQRGLTHQPVPSAFSVGSRVDDDLP